MKEKELVALGFTREECIEEGVDPFHYYTYDFGNGSFSLISNSSDEVKAGKWCVEVFDDSSIRFTNSSDVMGLIDVINRNTIKIDDNNQYNSHHYSICNDNNK